MFYRYLIIDYYVSKFWSMLYHYNYIYNLLRWDSAREEPPVKRTINRMNGTRKMGAMMTRLAAAYYHSTGRNVVYKICCVHYSFEVRRNYSNLTNQPSRFAD